MAHNGGGRFGWQKSAEIQRKNQTQVIWKYLKTILAKKMWK